MPFMLPVVLKNLLTGPATRMYPAVDRELPEKVRGHLEYIESDCIFCGTCMRKCPANAVEVDIKKELRYYIHKCIMCIVCAENCPKKCIKVESRWAKPFYNKSVYSFRAKPKEEKPKADADTIVSVKKEENPTPEVSSDNSAASAKSDLSKETGVDPASQNNAPSEKSSENKK